MHNDLRVSLPRIEVLARDDLPDEAIPKAAHFSGAVYQVLTYERGLIAGVQDELVDLNIDFVEVDLEGNTDPVVVWTRLFHLDLSLEATVLLDAGLDAPRADTEVHILGDVGVSIGMLALQEEVSAQRGRRELLFGRVDDVDLGASRLGHNHDVFNGRSTENCWCLDLVDSRVCGVFGGGKAVSIEITYSDDGLGAVAVVEAADSAAHLLCVSTGNHGA